MMPDIEWAIKAFVNNDQDKKEKGNHRILHKWFSYKIDLKEGISYRLRKTLFFQNEMLLAWLACEFPFKHFVIMSIIMFLVSVA